MKKYMELAIEEALLADYYGEVPIGAIIVNSKKQIIARAYNQVEHYDDPTAHAEILAIKEAAKYNNNWRLEGCTIYITLEPCLMCMGAIMNARIKRVVYGIGDNKKGAIESGIDLLRTSFLRDIEVYGGICEEECQFLLQNFFKNRR